MYIIRNGKKIELTGEELEQAYREKELQYTTEDAYQQLAEYFGINEEDTKEGCEWFERAMGVSFDEAVNENSEHYMLKDMAQDFLDNYTDCENSANSSWNALIHCMIEERKRAA